MWMFSNAEAIYFNVHTHTRTHTHARDIPDLFYFSFFLSRRLCVKILDSCVWVCFNVLLLSLVRSGTNTIATEYIVVGVYHSVPICMCARVCVKYYECATVCQSVCAHIAKHTHIRAYACVLIFGWCVCVCVLQVRSRRCEHKSQYLALLSLLRGLRFPRHRIFYAYVCTLARPCLYEFVCISFAFFFNERDIEPSLSS